MHVIRRGLTFPGGMAADLARCPVSWSVIGCRSSLMYFSVRTHSHSRIVNRFPQIASFIVHTARLSLTWTSTDFPPTSGICLQFIKTCRLGKNWAKIVQCELGISCKYGRAPVKYYLWPLSRLTFWSFPSPMRPTHIVLTPWPVNEIPRLSLSHAWSFNRPSLILYF